ncbi:MAG: putative transport protein [Candidatus Marinimicrobia bacterium]|nr:putative transport protein [Candidatus Neomarinimicrobiota bacterium]
MVALLQGFLGGIAFWILGLPSPIFWGAVMAFLSIFPVIGAPLVYLPAAAILLIQGSLPRGLILLIWGTLIVSQIDNFLRPILISGRAKLHTLILFFSILGGIYIFGFLGIIMGPVVAALFLTMIKIYRDELVPETPDPNTFDSIENSEEEVTSE